MDLMFWPTQQNNWWKFYFAETDSWGASRCQLDKRLLGGARENVNTTSLSITREVLVGRSTPVACFLAYNSG